MHKFCGQIQDCCSNTEVLQVTNATVLQNGRELSKIGSLMLKLRTAVQHATRLHKTKAVLLCEGI